MRIRIRSEVLMQSQIQAASEFSLNSIQRIKHALKRENIRLFSDPDDSVANPYPNPGDYSNTVIYGSGSETLVTGTDNDTGFQGTRNQRHFIIK